MKTTPQRHPAFTLVELLVVIAIIGILVALLLPAVQAAREAARRTQCNNALKQIGLAIQLYADNKSSTLPAGRMASPVGVGSSDGDAGGEYSVSWAFLLLPYMEQQAIFDSLQPGVKLPDPANATAMRTPVDTFYCPSRRSPAADRDFDSTGNPPVPVSHRGLAAGGDYAANVGAASRMESGVRVGDVTYAQWSGWTPAKSGPMITDSKIKMRMVTDGLSNTFAVGEKHIPSELSSPFDKLPGAEHFNKGDTAFFAGNHPWAILRNAYSGFPAAPDDEQISKFGSDHSGNICQFVYLDAHVDSLTYSTPLTVLHALSTIAGGEVIGEDGATGGVTLNQ